MDNELCEICDVKLAAVVWVKNGGRGGIRYLCDQCSENTGFNLLADGFACLETPALEYMEAVESVDDAFGAAEDLALETDYFDDMVNIFPEPLKQRVIHSDREFTVIFDLAQMFSIPCDERGDDSHDYRIILATIFDNSTSRGDSRSMLLVDEDGDLRAIFHPENGEDLKRACQILTAGAMRNL